MLEMIQPESLQVPVAQLQCGLRRDADGWAAGVPAAGSVLSHQEGLAAPGPVSRGKNGKHRADHVSNCDTDVATDR